MCSAQLISTYVQGRDKNSWHVKLEVENKQHYLLNLSSPKTTQQDQKKKKAF